jgi:hypothetical protein
VLALNVSHLGSLGGLPQQQSHLSQNHFVSLALYCAIAARAQALDRQEGRKIEAEKWARAAHALASVHLWAAPLVSLVYWTVLFPGTPSGVFRKYIVENLAYHALNTPAAVADLMLSRLQPDRWQLLVGTVYGMGYCVWAYLFHAITGHWLYFFLDYTRRDPPLLQVPIMLGLLLLALATHFAVFRSAAALRERIALRKGLVPPPEEFYLPISLYV